MYFKTSLSYTGPKKYILRSAGTDSVWGFYSTEEKKKKKSRPIQMSLLIWKHWSEFCKTALSA